MSHFGTPRPSPFGLPVLFLVASVGCGNAGLDDRSEAGSQGQEDPPGDSLAFETVAVLDLGQAPHQISFAPDGSVAFIAMSGSDQIVRVDAERLEVTGSVAVAPTPLGVAVLGDGGADGAELLVTRWGAAGIGRVRVGRGNEVSDGGDAADEEVWIPAGEGPSFLVGPLPGWGPVPGGAYLASSERANTLSIIGKAPVSLSPADYRLSLESGGPSGATQWSASEPGPQVVATYPTGARPFPPSATSDGRLAFVPNYDDGTVTVVDLWNERIVATTSVGERPSGGAVLPWDIEYAVAVRGEDRIALVNTASWEVTGEILNGIGSSPFSVVVAPNGRLAFVNNTESHDISVIDLSTRSVITRVPVGEVPIAMGVHPSGETLWVSAEGTHEVWVLQIPVAWRGPDPRFVAPAGTVTEVAVMGMIHGSHRTSESWGLDQLRETIRQLDPDVICIEVPPNRWDRIWSDYSERDALDDLRIRPFPEYTDVVLPLSREMDFEIVPCAGWSVEMNDLRSTRSSLFNESPQWADVRSRLQAETASVRERLGPASGEGDDPTYIHSPAFDDRTRASYLPRATYQNELFGLGGWININEAHMALIEKTIREHAGKRILVTFGSAHKYWYMDRLRDRADVRLLDLVEYLPGLGG